MMVKLYLVEPVPNGWMGASNDPTVREMNNGDFGFSLDKFTGIVVRLLDTGHTVTVEKADSMDALVRE